jgi:hypothetical protein
LGAVPHDRLSSNSKFVIAAYLKGVPAKQLSEQTARYNEAVLEWESEVGLYSIRLKTLFASHKSLAKWESIRAQRDQLDIVIYQLTQGDAKSADGAAGLVDAIAEHTVELSRQLISEIGDEKRRERGTQ